MAKKKLLTLKQVSEKHGVSVATLRRWIAAGGIPQAIRSEVKIGSGYVWLIPEGVDIPVPSPSGARHPNYHRTMKNEDLTELS